MIENQIIHGDCREVLAGMPDESVDCAVTSPQKSGWGCLDKRNSKGTNHGMGTARLAISRREK